jgi:hypothetical protein
MEKCLKEVRRMESGYKAFHATEDLLEHEELNRFLENAAMALGSM